MWIGIDSITTLLVQGLFYGLWWCGNFFIWTYESFLAQIKLKGVKKRGLVGKCRWPQHSRGIFHILIRKSLRCFLFISIHIRAYHFRLSSLVFNRLWTCFSKELLKPFKIFNEWVARKNFLKNVIELGKSNLIILSFLENYAKNDFAGVKPKVEDFTECELSWRQVFVQIWPT